MLTEGTSSLRAWEMRERETNELLFPLGQKWDLFIATRPLLGQCQFITPPQKKLHSWIWAPAIETEQTQLTIVNY